MDTLLGLLFVFLWSSASTATKLATAQAAPLTVLCARFAIAAPAILASAHLLRRQRLPIGAEWRHLAVIGIANSTLFLGASWLGLRETPVGLYSLFIASNPFLVAVMSSVWLGRQVTRAEWVGISLAALGIAVVAVPLIDQRSASPGGVALLVVAMLSYSAGSVYLKRCTLALPPTTMNGWQMLLGLLPLLPLAGALDGGQGVPFTPVVVGSLLWLIVMVSFLANALLFRLQQRDPLRASAWLLLSPIISYAQAAIVLGEPVRWTDALGAGMVIAGLALAGILHPQLGRDAQS